MRSVAALLVVLSVFAWADPAPTSHAYAYPTPWACGDGDLTFHLEISWELSSPPVFVVVDLAGEEVVRVSGSVPWTRVEGEDYVYEAVWDGRNADGRPVAPGTFICYVEGIQETAFRFIVTR